MLRTTAALFAASATLGLAACGDDTEDTSSNPAPAASQTETTPDAAAEKPAAESSDSGASGDKPSWAQEPTKPGEKIATVKAGDITVDVYQVGTTKATKKGQFVDPDTNKPIIDKGDEIVFVNYVITNNGDDIDLGSSLVRVEARYKDWKYLQGMDAIVDDALFEEQNVRDSDLAPGAYNEDGIYTLAKGQSFSYGENFRYQADSPIEFKVTAVPVDAEGELLHDQKLEGTGDGTIK